METKMRLKLIRHSTVPTNPPFSHHNTSKYEQKCLLFRYVNLQQTLTGSILGRDVSSIHVLWKSIQQFSCNPADKPTNEWTLAPTLVCVCTVRYRQNVKCHHHLNELILFMVRKMSISVSQSAKSTSCLVLSATQRYSVYRHRGGKKPGNIHI